MDFVSGLILGLLFVAFLFVGYKEEYKRNSGDFWRSLVSMPVRFVAAVLGLGCFNNRLKAWANKSPQNNCDNS